MLKFCSITFIIPTLLISVFSQTPRPTPSPQKKEKDVVKITTSLIQIDVSVTDRNGRIIKDLAAEDFQVFENDTEQKITNFTFVSAEDEFQTNMASGDELLEIPPPPPVSELKPSEIRRTIALVIDDISLSFESVHYVRRTLRNFIEKQMKPGDLVAIIRASGGLGSLQQFTANKQYLYRSIEKIQWKKNRGTGQISSFQPFSVAAGDLDPQNFDGDVTTSEDDLDSFRNSIFASGTLGAVKYVIEGMEKLPGRKSVMLLSDGFQIFTKGSNNQFTESTRVVNAMTKLVEAANRASVVIYTMDMRGLQTLGFDAADNLGSRPIYNKLENPNEGATTAVTLDKLEKATLDRRNKFFSSQDGLSYLAKETGGLFIRNTNDLNGGIRKMLEDQSYYLLAYEPDSDTFDPDKNRFNKLDIKVKREGVKVRYRSGFFGTSPENETEEAASKKMTPNEQLNNALISPFPVNDVSIKLSSLFQGTEKRKLFINSLLFIDVSNLDFKDSGNGRKKAVFDLLAANFDENGVPTDQLNKTFSINVTGEIYERMIKEGFIYYFTLPIKDSGAYQMRVAIRDQETGKIGSTNQIIGIPKLKNKDLALSGIALDNIPYKKWNAGLRSTRGRLVTDKKVTDEDLPALTDSAKRKFPRGSVLRYGLEIYNAAVKKKRKSGLLLRTRVFRDNKLVYEGRDQTLDLSDISKKSVKPVSGAINLGTEIDPGDYILQIIIMDTAGRKNRQIATQFIQFEITK